MNSQSKQELIMDTGILARKLCQSVIPPVIQCKTEEEKWLQSSVRSASRLIRGEPAIMMKKANAPKRST
jgi:hypothetical protein